MISSSAREISRGRRNEPEGRNIRVDEKAQPPALGEERRHVVFRFARDSSLEGDGFDEALSLMDEALQIVERTGERWFAAELNRRKGQLLLRQGHSGAAEELYRKAMSIALEQEAKLWELRAAASLARLRRDQGRDAEARDLLAPVYGWFTEGYDTPDLKEAKALLDELA
jgi:predicted ATPase